AARGSRSQNQSSRAARRQHLPVHGLSADRRRGDRGGAAMTEYIRPRSIEEAVAARAAHPDYMVLAGATDLMVDAKHKRVPAGIVDLWRVPGLFGIRDTDHGIAIGAGATWLEVQRHAKIFAHWT